LVPGNLSFFKDILQEKKFFLQGEYQNLEKIISSLNLPSSAVEFKSLWIQESKFSSRGAELPREILVSTLNV